MEKERRVINVLKSDYDFIKKFCDREALDMPKWIVKTVKEKILELEENKNAI